MLTIPFLFVLGLFYRVRVLQAFSWKKGISPSSASKMKASCYFQLLNVCKCFANKFLFPTLHIIIHLNPLVFIKERFVGTSRFRLYFFINRYIHICNVYWDLYPYAGTKSPLSNTVYA